MKSKYIAITILSFLIGFVGLSQKSINDYSYIEVPEVYEFLDEKDQYQLNSLTKFLFNKHGFNAYFSSELPNVRKCDGLYAYLESELGFIYTKTVVVVKDCNDVELFRSAEGRSKLKDFRQTYHQSLRNAFKSFEDLGINQKALEIDPYNSETTNVSKDNLVVETPIAKNYPTARFSSYNSNGIAFLLRKTNTGYSLSQEVAGANDDLQLVGTLTFENDTVKFKDIAGAVTEAYFDENLNLIIKGTSGERFFQFSGN